MNYSGPAAGPSLGLIVVFFLVVLLVGAFVVWRNRA
jgi:hypothetical protein